MKNIFIIYLVLFTALSLSALGFEIYGELPQTGSQAPDFILTETTLSDVTLEDYKGKNIILNIFPSIDTPVCQSSVLKFNEEASQVKETIILAVSQDLPFAMDRYCLDKDIKNIYTLSAFRSPDFGKDYGILITTGMLKGLFARAIVAIDKEGKVVYTELVPKINQEPDYESVLNLFR